MSLEKLGLTEYGEFLEQVIQEESAHSGKTGLELVQAFETDLICHANALVGYGVSHRGLQVGACALAYDANGMPLLLEGFNYSPYKGVRKRCAEIGALAMGLERGVVYIPAFWIAAPTDKNLPRDDNLNHHVNGIEAPTLHLCFDPCRMTLSRSPLVDNKKTTFTTITSATAALERHTLAEYSALYDAIQTPQSSYQLARRAS